MGLGIWPEFNPRGTIHPKLDGKLLFDTMEALDVLARALGLTPPSHYADNREVPAGLDGDPDTLEEILGPWDEWFTPQTGLLTFAGLAEAMLRPEVARNFQYPEDLLFELRDVERCLQQAQDAGVRFRLEVL